MSEVSTGSELSAVEVAALAKRGDTVSQRRFVGVHILLLLGGVLMVFPFVYQILMSLSTNMEIQSVPPKLIPDRWQFHNYTEVFTRLPFLKQFGVSVTITVLRTVVQLILCSMGGYAFARMKFGGKSVLFGFVLAILMVPGQSYLIGQYEIIRELGLLETPWGIVLPGFFSAFGVFLMRQSFMSLPAELEEAARLDGCNPWQTFWRVMVPVVKPGLFAVMITTVLWSWNDLLWPLNCHGAGGADAVERWHRDPCRAALERVRAHDGGLRDGHGADLPPLLLDATQGHRGARQFGAQGLSAGRWLSGASAGIAKTFPGKWFERADVAHVATDGHVLTVPRRGLFFVTFCT